MNNDVPILCIARDVACNVRGGFFKYVVYVLAVYIIIHILFRVWQVLFWIRDFDNGFSQKIAEVAHEDDIKDIIPPDVSNYLTSENSNEKFTVVPENDLKDISSSDVSNYLTLEACIEKLSIILFLAF